MLKIDLLDPPQSHSTPKAAHHSQIRPESATPMSREQKLTWGRCELFTLWRHVPVVPFSISVPPAAGYRSASAMGQHMRPASRQSDAGIAQCKLGIDFRIQIIWRFSWNTCQNIYYISSSFFFLSGQLTS